MFTHVLGHTNALGLLASLRDLGPKAVLLQGPSGLGKAFIVQALTKGLLCASSPCACTSCTQIDAGTHPNVRALYGERGELTIDGIRSLDHDLNKTGTSIIQLLDIQHLTQPASHALLKTMEQSRAIFLLTGTLTPEQFHTLRSRCYDIPFYPVGEAPIRQYLLRRDPAIQKEVMDLLAQLSDGNFQQAEQCLLGRYQTVRDTTLTLLNDLMTRPPHTLFERTANLEDDPDAEGTLTLIRTTGLSLLRDLLLVKRQQADLIRNRDVQDKLEGLEQKVHISTLRAVTHAWQNLGLQKPRGQTAQQHLRFVLIQLKALFPVRKNA